MNCKKAAAAAVFVLALGGSIGADEPTPFPFQDFPEIRRSSPGHSAPTTTISHVLTSKART